MLEYKAKGQQGPVLKPELLALVWSGGLAEWLIAPVSKTGNGATNTVQGSESLTRRQIASPVKALTSGEKNRTAEAARIRKFSIRLLAVELNRRFHSGLPFLPDRVPQIR